MVEWKAIKGTAFDQNYFAGKCLFSKLGHIYTGLKKHFTSTTDEGSYQNVCYS